MSLRMISKTALAAAAGLFLLCSSTKTPIRSLPGSAEVSAAIDSYHAVYENTGIGSEISYRVFEQAMTGYDRIGDRKKSILVLIDYSKPSTEERLYVIDVPNRKLLYKSLVAHGRGSGDNYATNFSNVPGSHKSSLGFFLTGETYEGRNGFSLRLIGLEKGINDNAYERAIVIHGADYCAPSFIASVGRLGRSFGCPALPKEVNKPIIDTIKEGAVLFIYGEDEGYNSRSPILASLPEQEEVGGNNRDR